MQNEFKHIKVTGHIVRAPGVGEGCSMWIDLGRVVGMVDTGETGVHIEFQVGDRGTFERHVVLAPGVADEVGQAWAAYRESGDYLRSVS